MWSIEFVQVLDETKQKEKEGQKDNTTESSVSLVSGSKAIPVLKRASSSSVVDPSPTEDILAAERLQEFKDSGTRLAAKEVELGSSAESDSGNPVENLREHLDRVSQLQQADRVSLGSNNSSDDLVGYGREPIGDVDSAVDVAAVLDNSSKGITSQPSKDQTSPTSDFVFVTENEVKDAVKSANESVQKFSPRKLRGLREGIHLFCYFCCTVMLI